MSEFHGDGGYLSDGIDHGEFWDQSSLCSHQAGTRSGYELRLAPGCAAGVAPGPARSARTAREDGKSVWTRRGTVRFMPRGDGGHG